MRCSFPSALLTAAVLITTLFGAAPVDPPIVVVFPFSGATSAAPTAGADLANVLAQRLPEGNEVVVKAAPPDTPRLEFLTIARRLGADFYVSGFITPIGGQLATIEQIVNVRNGIVVWRNSEMLHAPTDVTNTVGQIRGALETMHASLTAAAFGAPSGATSASGAAPARSASAPAPTRTMPPTPVPTATPPSTKAVVLGFAGGDAASKELASEALVDVLPRYGVAASASPVDNTDVLKVGLLLCEQTGADLLFGGSVGTHRTDPETMFGYEADVSLHLYNCRDLAVKPRTYEGTAMNSDLRTAVDLAVQQAARGLSASRR